MEILLEPNYSLRPSEKAALEVPLSKEVFLPYNVDLTVFFGGHSEKEEFNALYPHLLDADIFVPEVPQWTEDEISLYSRVTQGDKDACTDLLFLGGEPTPFHAARAIALLGSNVRIAPIDIPATDPHAKYIDKHFDVRGTHEGTLEEVIDSDFSQTLDNILRLANREVRIENYRESRMARSIGPRLEALINNDPELQAKNRIKVVLQLGTYHTNLYKALTGAMQKNTNTTMKQVFGQPMPIVYNHFDRITRSARANVKLSYDERSELAMRALGRAGLAIGAIPLVLTREDFNESGELVFDSTEEMVDRFTPEAIQEFHQRLVQLRNQGK